MVLSHRWTLPTRRDFAPKVNHNAAQILEDLGRSWLWSTGNVLVLVHTRPRQRHTLASLTISETIQGVVERQVERGLLRSGTFEIAGWVRNRGQRRVPNIRSNIAPRSDTTLRVPGSISLDFPIEKQFEFAQIWRNRFFNSSCGEFYFCQGEENCIWFNFNNFHHCCNKIIVHLQRDNETWL